MISVAFLPLLFPAAPAPGLARSRAWARQYDCERIADEVALQRYPGRVRPSSPEEDPDRTVVICHQRLLSEGLREPRDEAVLRDLRDTADAIAVATEGLRPGLGEVTWLVDVHYPDGAVADKIGFATKNALMKRSLSVSDRVPLLTASDLGVLTRMPPEQAYPKACRRYHDTGSLGDDEVLVAVVQLDVRQTTLLAGICHQGRWGWLP